MACFRAITGQEESVSAIFHSLKKKKYSGADKLNPRNHVHKAAFRLFCIAVSQIFQRLIEFGFEPTIVLKDKNGTKRLLTRITINLPYGHKKYGYPIPPLYLNIKVNDKLHDFSEELMNIVSDQKAANIISFIKKEANWRNKFLYASNMGIPSLTNSIDNFLITRKEEIFVNLIIFLLIDPYNEKQLFAQQALHAFLKMLNIIEGVDFGSGW